MAFAVAHRASSQFNDAFEPALLTLGRGHYQRTAPVTFDQV
jgi:hypothetical protein